MRKNYIAPMVVYSEASSSPDLAGKCATANTFDPNKCPIDLQDGTGDTLFIENITCTYEPMDGDKICYHAPTDTTSIFAS